jgi:enoyl-CoA hydratase
MPTVLKELIRPGIALVTLNRPDSLNAMTLELVNELSRVLDELAADDECRVVILTGAGRGFCSGHQLADMRHGDGAGGSAVASMGVQRSFSGLTMQIDALPQPVIAAVNGPAAGGGLALALAADTRICGDTARFNAAFVRIGLSGCDMGVSYFLPRIVGATLAYEMMLTGRLIDAEEALGAGLVLKVVSGSGLIDEAIDLAERMRANSPFGVQMTKQVMRANLDAPSLRSAIDLEDRTQIVCSQTRDQQEALGAFMGKGQPTFTNS